MAYKKNKMLRTLQVSTQVMPNGRPKSFSDCTFQTENGVMDPFPHLLPYEMDPLVRGYVEWDFMSVDQASYKPPENGAGCGSVSTKGKPILGINMLRM